MYLLLSASIHPRWHRGDRANSHQRRVANAGLLGQLAASAHLLRCYPPFQPLLPILMADEMRDGIVQDGNLGPRRRRRRGVILGIVGPAPGGVDGARRTRAEGPVCAYTAMRRMGARSSVAVRLVGDQGRRLAREDAPSRRRSRRSRSRRLARRSGAVSPAGGRRAPTTAAVIAAWDSVGVAEGARLGWSVVGRGRVGSEVRRSSGHGQLLMILGGARFVSAECREAMVL